MRTNVPSIAVLLTCHNRKEKTLQCLQALYQQKGLNDQFVINVFLVDDGSTDGTGSAVKSVFPSIYILQGTGNLFWNQGMRFAWQSAVEANDFDFFLWLNDDTLLDKEAVIKILEDYAESKTNEQTEVLITGVCRSELGSDNCSYGGRDESGLLLPNGKPQKCKYINGNVVLVSNAIYQKLGNLSNDYTHGMGDFDYGLRALKAGFRCYTTSHYIATCPPNEGTPGWCNPNLSLKKRWELFHSPRGLNISEYIKFRKKFWGFQWINFAMKAYAKMISPKLYKKIS